MKIGLLPLYISLYDENHGYLRERLAIFYDKIADLLKNRGLEVVTSEICTEEPHFAKEVKRYEDENCDAIVTLHLAYSPGLNSDKILANTKLPIIICDTTETFDFSDHQDSAELLYCHGIHGVMEMCNLLKKNKKPYAVVAGHYETSDVIDRVVGYISAAKAANSVNGSKVGSIGGYFDGMGDFRVDDTRMKEYFGATVIRPEKNELTELAKSVTEDEIKAEQDKNASDYIFLEEPDADVYKNSVIADLTLKKWIAKNNLQAFSVNFRQIGELYTMPFNGICCAMSEGIGYAGEGDTFTALFTGALMQGYQKTSFIEIFCPDWKNNTIFISHMGEMNHQVADGKPTAYENVFTYADCPNPVVSTAAFMPGNGVFLNIFEDEKGFNAFIAPVEVLKETTDNFQKSIRGWLDFKKPVSDVLEKISECGATHHSILVYDAKPEEIAFFAKLLNINPICY